MKADSRMTNRFKDTIAVLLVAVLTLTCFEVARADIGSELVGAGSETVSAEKRTSKRNVFNQVKDGLIIVQCDTSSGSGFVVEMENGTKWFVTNKHVVEGQKRVAAFLLDGRELKLGAFQVAKDRDLVRFSVDEKTKSMTISGNVPNIGDAVFVFGNSDGEGVATDLCGEIVGVGPKQIEVSNKFVHGNSGSAVIDEQGTVLGVATFATYDYDVSDWTKIDTRFANVRRFALRFTGVEWEAMEYSSFYKKCVEEAEQQQKEKGVFPQASISFKTPKLYFSNVFKTRLIMSDITIAMRGACRDMKNPVIRVCVVVQGATGEYYMEDCLIDKAGSLRYVRECPPVYSYGNVRDGWRYSIGNNQYVYYLEGLSYWQTQFPAEVRKSEVKYFNKSKDATDRNALFSVSEECCMPGKPPKIVCFRFEAWQNGSLAGAYDSQRPATLNAKGIPVDWFVKNKYPKKFKYNARGVRCRGW